MRVSMPPMGITHCKYCKYFREYTPEYTAKIRADGCNADGDCGRFIVAMADTEDAKVTKDDYCSWAVRKEQGDDEP